MATNPYVNKVMKSDGTTIMDISDSTVTAANLAEGKTAYDASGELITGTMQGGLDMNVKFTSGYEIIPDYMFYNSLNTDISKRIKEVVIGDGVTRINSYAFYRCSNLSSITIPNTVTIIEYYAFNSCANLPSITIPNSVTSIDSTAFSNCTKLTTITINKRRGSVSGAPWGATNATVVWTG